MDVLNLLHLVVSQSLKLWWELIGMYTDDQFKCEGISKGSKKIIKKGHNLAFGRGIQCKNKLLRSEAQLVEIIIMLIKRWYWTLVTTNC